MIPLNGRPLNTKLTELQRTVLADRSEVVRYQGDDGHLYEATLKGGTELWRAIPPDLPLFEDE
jgi:hypothetical protein